MTAALMPGMSSDVRCWSSTLPSGAESWLASEPVTGVAVGVGTAVGVEVGVAGGVKVGSLLGPSVGVPLGLAADVGEGLATEVGAGDTVAVGVDVLPQAARSSARANASERDKRVKTRAAPACCAGAAAP
jgi:hypothetical protein